MIDLHCHVLPGEEGGPATAEDGVALLTAMLAGGVDTAAVTPFIAAGDPADRPSETAARIRALREAAGGEQLPALIPAAEVDLAWALGVAETDLRHATFGGLGKTLLVRTPMGETPPDFDDLLLSLKLRGYTLVLAHPERSASYQSAAERIGRLVAAGVLIQLDADSILGNSEPRARRLARILLEEEFAHVIASDARPELGAPPLSQAAEAAESVVGMRARWMTMAAPAALLAGAPLPNPPAADAGRGRKRTRGR